MPQLTNERNKTMVAGATAGVAEALATMPFEVTKNRIQMGHGPPAILLNARDTVAKKGVRGLYYGLQPQLLQVSAKSSLRFVAFETYQRMLPGSTFTCGMLAGLTEALVLVAPTERLKILRTAELRAGAHSAGASSSVFHAAGALVREQGVAGLWHGAAPTAARQMLANGLRFFFYDHFKAALKGVPGSAAIAGGMTGVVSVVLTNPVDVVKTRIQAAPAGGGLGAQVGTVREMIAAEGWVSLTRGMSARALKIGSGQAVIFGVFDCVKRRL
mmetsp:Transcript_9149/g.29428  ORF Transcript_9149/g.29428 Transcript_9149/m.29428 type:complete len:272 (+) Transcript_9149:189-1004(+)